MHGVSGQACPDKLAGLCFRQIRGVLANATYGSVQSVTSCCMSRDDVPNEARFNLTAKTATPSPTVHVPSRRKARPCSSCAFAGLARTSHRMEQERKDALRSHLQWKGVCSAAGDAAGSSSSAAVGHALRDQMEEGAERSNLPSESACPMELGRVRSLSIHRYSSLSPRDGETGKRAGNIKERRVRVVKVFLAYNAPHDALQASEPGCGCLSVRVPEEFLPRFRSKTNFLWRADALQHRRV